MSHDTVVNEVTRIISEIRCLNRTQKSLIRHAVMVLGFPTATDYTQFTLKDVTRQLGPCSNHTIRSIRFVRNAFLPQWIRKLGGRTLSTFDEYPHQKILLLEQLGYVHADDRRRRAMRLGLLLHCNWDRITDIQGTKRCDIVRFLAAVPSPDKNMLYQTNVILEQVGCHANITMNEITRVKQKGLTREQYIWIRKNPEHEAWLHRTIEKISADAKSALKSQRMAIRLAWLVKLAHGTDPCTVHQVYSVIKECTEIALQHPQSLVSMNRTTRSSDKVKNKPGVGILKTIGRACELLQRVYRIKGEVRCPFLFKKLQHMFSSSIQIPDLNICKYNVVTAADVANALRATENDTTNHLLMLLLCRLGMRIGAVTNLRIAGVVLDVKPGRKWQIRRHISGIDKGSQVNSWDTHLVSSVHRTLQTYIREVWQPTYEIWNVDKSRLVNGYVFPSPQLYAKKDKPNTCLALRVRKILCQAGVDSFSAHPHACRKAFCTELLRAGNKVEHVARAMHHKNANTTLTSYDKRTDEEILANLRIPDGWKTEQTLHAVGTSVQGKHDNTSLLYHNAKLRTQLQQCLTLMTPEMIRQIKLPVGIGVIE